MIGPPGAHLGQSLIGTLQAQATLIPLGWLKVGPIQFHLYSHWKFGTKAGTHQNRWSRHHNHHNLHNLFTVVVYLTKLDTMCLIGVPSLNVHGHMTKGWGAHLDDVTCQGMWNQEESRLHINCLEMGAIRLALSHHFDIPPHSLVLVATHNTLWLPTSTMWGNKILVPLRRDRIIVCCCDSS